MRNIRILHTIFIFKELYIVFIQQSFKDVKFIVSITRQYILFVQCSDTEVLFISHSDGDILCLPVIATSFRHCWTLQCKINHIETYAEVYSPIAKLLRLNASAIIQTHKNLLNTSHGLYTLDPFEATSITRFLDVRITQ